VLCDKTCSYSDEATEGNHQLGCDVSSHPPHNPDLVPCDFWMFSSAKAVQQEGSSGVTMK
jgi:hypothetical protein